MLTKLTYARGEAEYQELYATFQQAAPQQILDYFNRHWHASRAEWVEGLKSEVVTLLTSTNNRAESTNQKLKTVIVKHSGIVEFFRSLISTLNSMNVERDHRALLVNQRVPTTAYAPDSAE